MSDTNISLATGDYLTPGFEHATVSDAMRHGVITCPVDTPLRAVARMMATNHVHSVVITGLGVDQAGQVREQPWGVVSDIDLVRSAREADDRTAGEVASPAVPTVQPDTPLADAAQLMGEHDLTHLVVVTPSTGQPAGVISTLDIAGNLAWARG